jgi:methyl-accepting chemotaxis protein
MRTLLRPLLSILTLVIAPWGLIFALVEKDQIAAYSILMILLAIVTVVSAIALVHAHISVVTSARTLALLIANIADEEYDPPIGLSASNKNLRPVFFAVEDLRHKMKTRADALLSRLKAMQAAIEQREIVGAAEASASVEAHSVFMKTFLAALDARTVGILSTRIEQPFSANHEELRQSYNASLDGIEAEFSNILDQMRNLSSQAEGASGLANCLSDRTRAQAAILEKVAGGLRSITPLTQSVTQAAQDVCQIMTDAKVEAEKSLETVRGAVGAMASIENSHKDIEKIIFIIDEIAFQTKLLALNAGVEAARAGDAGRGFAIIATEVRALAQRATDAAKEMKKASAASTSRIDECVNLVGQNRDGLGRIIESATDAMKHAADIANCAGRQARGVQETSGAITQMGQSILQNSTLSQNVSVATRDLQAKLDDIANRIVMFAYGGRMNVANVRKPLVSSQLEHITPRTRELSLPLRMPTSGQTALVAKANCVIQEQSWEEF